MLEGPGRPDSSTNYDRDLLVSFIVWGISFYIDKHHRLLLYSADLLMVSACSVYSHRVLTISLLHRLGNASIHEDYSDLN